MDKMMPELLRNTINILENILHGVIVTDMRGHILYWNNAIEELFGYSKSEMTGKPISVLYDEESELSFKSILKKCSTSESVYGRWHGLHKNGTKIWFDVRAKCVSDENGVPGSFVITLGDIDKLKSAEYQLKKNRAVAEAILRTSTDAIVTANEEGKILSFNRAAGRMFGYDENELVGKNLKILMPFSYSVNHENYMKKYLLSDIKKIIGKGSETQGLKKNGSIFPIELSVSEVSWEGNRIFAGIIRDLSTRRKLERQLIEIGNEERRRIGRDLHDGLGQMLSGIRMLSESVARKLKANSVCCADEVEEIAEMIGEADEFARILSRDMVQVDLEKGGLNVALQMLCKNTTKMTGVDCRFIESEKSEIENHSMALHLYRIVQEAVNNAVKHGNPEKITVRYSNNNYHISITVDDDGIGFENNPKSTEGVGLQIMKHRADIMGGILEIFRTDDELTRVRCIVPKNFGHLLTDPAKK